MDDFGTGTAPTETSLEDLAQSMIEPDEPEDAADEAETDAPDFDEDQADVSEDDAEPLAGDDDTQEDDDEEEGADTQEPLFTVRTDGTEEQVTLDELKRGYSGQTHIQRGLEAMAEDRKAFQSERAEFAQHQQQLGHLIQAAQQGGFTPPIPPNPDLMQTDPIGYMQEKEGFEQANAVYQQNLAVYQHQQAVMQQQQQAEQAHYLEQERQSLHKRLPDLADAEKGPALQRQMADVATSVYGFTMEEVRGLQDSRYAVVLSDLVALQQLRGSQENAIAKASQARPIAKAGAKTDQKRGKSRKQRERLRATGSDADALAMMLRG